MTDSADKRSYDVDRFRDQLQAIYAELDAKIQELAPICHLSGRCCRFREYDHTLFLTEAEALVLIADAPPPSRPLDSGDTCPWQDAQGRCTAREARPLGCRVYFCDPAYAPYAPELTERFLKELRSLAAQNGLPWNYAPLHVHLHRAHTEGTYKGEVDVNFPAPG